tara:strand:+ start:778 stop:1191 length:414 start_codon:yes stop_codon:yes gene_type:complete
MKLKDILNEITGTRIKVKDLSFNIIKDIFTDKYQEPSGTRMQPDGKEGPMYRYYDAVNLTNGDGSSQTILDAKALEQWKSGILGIEGINPDVEVTLSPEGDQYGRNSFIDDPVFKDREEKISKSISSTYGKGEYEGD